MESDTCWCRHGVEYRMTFCQLQHEFECGITFCQCQPELKFYLSVFESRLIDVWISIEYVLMYSNERWQKLEFCSNVFECIWIVDMDVVCLLTVCIEFQENYMSSWEWWFFGPLNSRRWCLFIGNEDSFMDLKFIDLSPFMIWKSFLPFPFDHLIWTWTGQKYFTIQIIFVWFNLNIYVDG